MTAHRNQLCSAQVTHITRLTRNLQRARLSCCPHHLTQPATSTAYWTSRRSWHPMKRKYPHSKRHFLCFVKACTVRGGHLHFLLNHTTIQNISKLTCYHNVNGLHMELHNDVTLRSLATWSSHADWLLVRHQQYRLASGTILHHQNDSGQRENQCKLSLSCLFSFVVFFFFTCNSNSKQIQLHELRVLYGH